MADQLLREFCAENMERVPAAIEAGAARIELCDNLAVGGTTPSFGVIEAAVAYAHARGVRVMAMIRPRGGTFVYSEAELAMMESDARIALALGSDGIVLGCLAANSDGTYTVDIPAFERLAAIVQEAGRERGERVDITFHMAFDLLDEAEQRTAIDALAERGITRILTHGGAAGTPIEANFERLRSMIAYAGERLVILPGGGITHQNAVWVSAQLGVHEVHGTKIVPLAC